MSSGGNRALPWAGGITRRTALGLLLVALAAPLACRSPGAAPAPAARPAAADALPSWREGEVRERILAFVAAVTDPGSPSFVPRRERIAVFDNDGTLWAERPLYTQVAFALNRLHVLAKDHPEWKKTEPYRTALSGDPRRLASLSRVDLAKILEATQTGMTPEAFQGMVRDWLASAKNPRTGLPYARMVYQPMLELLSYLRSRGFETWVVTGGGIDFVRAFSEDLYGVPPEQVIGSSPRYVFREGRGRSEVVREGGYAVLNDGVEKPIGIVLHIGQRPLLAVGNSDGDLPMLTYTADRTGPALALLVHHDDAAREFSYDHGAERALAAAHARDWPVVSIQRDFEEVFPPP